MISQIGGRPIEPSGSGSLWESGPSPGCRRCSVVDPLPENGELAETLGVPFIEGDPANDAVLIEAPIDEIDDAVEQTRACMAQASREILGGFEIRTDTETIRYPNRYMDPHGEHMWELVTEVLSTMV